MNFSRYFALYFITKLVSYSTLLLIVLCISIKPLHQEIITTVQIVRPNNKSNPQRDVKSHWLG